MGDEEAPTLYINEIQVCNTDQIIDPSYNYGSWIELYNAGSEKYTLGGLYISNDSTNLLMFKLANTITAVQPGGYRNIWFDHHSSDGNFGGKAYNQVRFKLNPEGGTVWLSDKDGHVICKADYPPATPRCSYARIVDGGMEWGTTSTPTPENSNAGVSFATSRLDAPVVNCDGGVYEQGSKVSMRVSVPAGTTLVYTTDGSTPTATNGTQCESQVFTVSSTSIYRFVAIKEGFLPSAVLTRSFIFKNHDYYLPVISVVTHPDNLYDNKIGIYCVGSNGISGNGVNSARNWNMDWERPVNVEYMVPELNVDGKADYVTHINQEVDMEICGGWSRGFGAGTVDGKYWPMRASFRLKCDKEYEGANVLDYPVFPLKPFNKYRVWQVRNGGNDTNARIIDPALTQIALRSDFYIDTQDCQPAHVFLNGAYLGMLNIRESNNRHFGYSNYGIDTDDMDQFDLSNAQYNQKVGTNLAWLALVNASANLAKEKTEEAYAKVCEMLDIDEYVNYMAYCCYMGPNDWITNTNNVKGFCSRSDDGKFHFVLFDTDSSFSSDNMTSSLIRNSYNANVDDLFRNLMKYPPFVRRFVDAFCLVDGSLFEPERCAAIIQELYNQRNRALGFEGNSSNMNLAGTIRSSYNGSRIRNLRSALSLPEPVKLRLASNLDQARLSVNHQLVPTGKFAGYLFDADGQGILLTAKAPVGYAFKGWRLQVGGMEPDRIDELIGEGSEWEYYDQGSMHSFDWTSPQFDAASHGWKQGAAPLGFASSGKNINNMLATKLSYGGNSNNKRPTYYFRKAFYLSELPGSQDVIELNYQVDDGFRFYLNGKDINGYRCPEGCAYDYLTVDWAGDEPDRGTFSIEAADLQLGWNVLAVEVHNCSASSSDIMWEAQLVHKVYEDSPEDYVSTDETFTLTDPASSPDLLAVYEEITDSVARLQMGASPIRVNEVSAGNDIHINEYGKRNDWVELYNPTSQPIDVAGMYLSDNPKKPQKWQITSSQASTVVPAHGSLIVWCDQLESRTQLHAPFKLDNADGASVLLQAQDGSWQDCLDYLEQPRWHTYGRYPDGGSYTALLSQPTINKANRLGSYDEANPSFYDFMDDDVYITLALAKGWNWTSHNLATDVHRSRFATAAQQMLGSSSSCMLDASANEWTGQLTMLKAGAGYKMICERDAEVTLRGDLYAAATTPVSLQAGWNWLGFPLFNATKLETALAHHRPAEGDVIVGIDAFATFEDGAWEGSLTTFQPGQAYLYRSADATSFCWNSLTTPRSIRRRYEAPAQYDEASPWLYDVHAYPDVMPVVAVEEFYDLDVSQPYTLGAFVGDECRGVATVEGERTLFAIHGQPGETVSFRLLDSVGENFAAQDTLLFDGTALVGSRREPFVLHFGTYNVEDRLQSPLSESSPIVSVEWYNLNGQRVARPKGLCMKVMRLQNGRVVTKVVNADRP